MPTVNALWSRQTYEGELGYPAADTGITTWDGLTVIDGFRWFSSIPSGEKMQVTTVNVLADIESSPDFEWEIDGVTYSIPMIGLVEP